MTPGERLKELIEYQERTDRNQGNIGDILNAFVSEYHAAILQYPDWPTDPVHAASILAEEAGEALKEANNYRWQHKRSPEESFERMRREAIQTGAMAIRFLLGFEDYEGGR